MRLDKNSFAEIDNKIKDHKVKRLKAAEKATIIRTDIMERELANMSTMGISKENDEVDLILNESMISTGVLKKK